MSLSPHEILGSVLARVQALLDEEEESNSDAVNRVRFSGGKTALHLASKFGLPDSVKLLLEQGANINCEERWSRTPLYMACQYGQWDVGRLLLSWPFAKARIPASAIYYSILFGNLDFTKMLVREGATFSYQTSKEGKNLLHVASERGHLDVVKYLLQQRGFNTGSKDMTGKTALHHAASSGNNEIVKFLILEMRIEAHPTDGAGNTPFHIACKDGPFLPLMRFFIDCCYADVNQKNRKGETPLLLVARRGTRGTAVHALNLLIDKGACVTHANNLKETALHFALEASDITSVNLLLQKGAHCDATTYLGETPLLVASRKEENVDAVRLLINHGADVNHANSCLETPLHRAVICKPLGYRSDITGLTITSLLVESGANANAQDNRGITPLHLASRQGNHQQVQYLLTHSDPNIVLRDNIGSYTALHVAKNVDIAKLLVEEHAGKGRSALLYTLNSLGHDPLMQEQAAKRRDGMIDFLESYTALPLTEIEALEEKSAVASKTLATQPTRKRKRDGCQGALAVVAELDIKLNSKLTLFQRSLARKMLNLLQRTELHPVASAIMDFLSPGDLLELDYITLID